MISIAVPTYKQPKCLDYLLRSFVENSANKDNEIVIVVDGTINDNIWVAEKYKEQSNIKFISIQQNIGMCRAQNFAVSRCSNNKILICNDDHVLPKDWDTICEESYDFNSLTIFNEVQTKRNVYLKYALGQDFGTIDDFKFDEYSKWTGGSSEIDPRDYGYAALPFMVNKWKYLALNGFDDKFVNGIKADADFFVRAMYMGMKFKYDFRKPFFHFGSMTVNDVNLSKEKMTTRIEAEIIGRKYCQIKWNKGNIESFDGRNFLFDKTVVKELDMIK